MTVARSFRRALGCLAVLAAACSRTDGAPIDPASLHEMSCVYDHDCGVGRHCDDSSLCAIDCIESKDCSLLSSNPSAANDMTCSPCGRCLAPGEHDTRCLDPSAVPCATDGDCMSRVGPSAVCTSDRICSRSCQTDDQCAELGRGWTCGPGVCQRSCFRELDCVFHGWGFGCTLPQGVDPTANEESDAPSYGVCEGLPGGVDFGPNASTDGPGGAYQGVWGWLVVVAVRTTGIPVITQEDTYSIEPMLVKITHDGDGKLTFHEKWCGLELKNFRTNDLPIKDLAPEVVPDRYADNLPLHEQHTLTTPPDLVAGASFDTDRMLDVRGARLPDPESSRLPDWHDATYAWDQDRDGNPGMTLGIGGVLPGEIYQSIRWSLVQHITVVDHDHLHGLVDTVNEQTIIGASTTSLLYDLTSTTHPDADRSYFRAVRMADDASCKDVLALHAGGGWLTQSAHFDASETP